MRPPLWRGMLRVSSVAGSLLALLACGSDTSPAPTAPENAYWALRLNYPAVNIAMVAPYNTVHLAATPLNAAGAPISGASAVRYRLSHQYDAYLRDSSVTVDSITGVVTAKDSSTQGQYSIRQVVASLTIDGVTHTDIANIRVTATAPSVPITRLTFLPHGSGKPLVLRDMYQSIGTRVVTATDAHGDSIPVRTDAHEEGLVVSCASSELAVASFDDHLYGCDVFAHEYGNVMLYTTTLVYGTVIHDTVQAQVLYRLYGRITVTPYTPLNSLTQKYRFQPPQVTITPGGVVDFFCVGCADSIDVVFDDSTSLTGGIVPSIVSFRDGVVTLPGNIRNVNVFDGAWSAADTFPAVKLFPKAGTYRFHSQKYGSEGTVYVSDTLLTTKNTP